MSICESTNLEAEIIRKYQSTAPVNLEAMANDLGITVLYVKLEYDVSGIVRKDDMLGGKSGYVIMVNSDDHKNRQRFTLAHELAHYILHKDFIGDGIKEDALYRSNKLSSNIERQANILAAFLLMPRQLVDQLMDEHYDNIKVVAEKLEVSKQALEIFLKSIGRTWHDPEGLPE